MLPGESAPVVVHGTITRKGVPNRDRTELRAAVQESVHQFATMKRARLLPALREKFPDESEEQIMERLDDLQPEYPEFDPVVELAIMGADHSNSPELRRSALAESAQYVRPKLKSIEHTVDPASAEMRAERSMLAARLVGLLDAGAQAKRSTVIEGRAGPVAPVVDQEG